LNQKEEMKMQLGTAWASVLAVGCMLTNSAAGASAQTVSVLKIEIENYVPYHYEVFDPSKFATSTDLTAAQPAIPFGLLIVLGDIVAVNGRPVKGVWAARATDLFLTPTVGVQPPNQPPQGRQAIGDVQRGHIQDMIWDILDVDSNPIGTITASGFSRGPRAPGAPSDVTLDALTITGGTGAFFGIRGQAGLIDLGSPRQATVVEAPANRRVLGGAKRSYLLQIVAMTTPEVAMTPAGPAIEHAADSTPISGAKPAKAGEIITIYAFGLGPTRGVPFGTPYPASGTPVTAPIDVVVNGSPADVLYAGGYPGSTDGYQINVRLPVGLATGKAELKIRSAWIEGTSFLIPIE
jgi:uncharacterized protein (TIGR03437 family)